MRKPGNPVRRSVVVVGAAIVAVALWFVEAHPAPPPDLLADPDSAAVPVPNGRGTAFDLRTDGELRTDAAVRVRARKLLLAARKLYGEAEDVVAKAPRTGIDAAHLASARNAGGRFRAAERAYQSAIVRSPSVDLIADANLQHAVLNLGAFEPAIYTVVDEVLGTCDVRGARADLTIAKSYLAEVERDLAGRGTEDWEPPDRSEDAGESTHCS